MSRQKNFDNNRQLNQENMEDLQQKICELEAVLRQQEQKIIQQNQQIAAAANQQQQLQYDQQVRQQQEQQQHVLHNEFQFNMSANDVIEQFRRLKPLDEKHHPRAFIHAVEANLTVCGNNEFLAQFCIGIVANEKILGNAGRRTRELQNNASWEEIKNRILQEFRPKRTYAEIFNFCRTVKVRNLNELFSIFERCKYEINDIYLADQFKPSIYKPENVNRDLVDILLEKIDGPIRAHIGEHETLTDITLKYTKLKLLDDTRAIAYNHRINMKYKLERNYSRKKPDSNKNFLFPNSNWKNSETGNSCQYRPNNNFGRDNFQKQNSGNFRTNQQERYPHHSNIGNWQGNKDNKYSDRNQVNEGRSNRTRNSYMSVDQQTTHMDIGNGEEKEVNFLIQPHQSNYP